MVMASQWVVVVFATNRDRMMESQVADKIKEVERNMQQLERQEKAVMANIRTKSEQRKLTIF